MEDNRLKHRLVGATVLVALGVVFFPLWLDMRPGPGTRLEKTNIPARPQWHFFKSEEAEHQAIVPPQQVTAPESSATADASVETPPAATPESSTPAEEQPPSVSAKAQPPPPPSSSPRSAGTYITGIKEGISLYGVFAKANLGADQVRALLRLGTPVKSLEALQSGRNLWIKAGPQKELQELIYYGPGHKVFAHVIRRGGHLQMADSASAIRTLTDQGDATAERVTPEVAERPAPAVTQARQPVAPPISRTTPAKPSTSPQEAARRSPPETVRPLAETRRTEALPPTPPLAPVVRPQEPSYLPTHTAPLPPPSHPSATAGAWVVQIASLKREESARALRDNLRSKGFPAFLESLYDGPNKQWRVRVGPSTERSEVDSLRTRLERDAHLPGQVLPYP
ncbi:DedD protein [Gammaproteobacteria bacterium]